MKAGKPCNMAKKSSRSLSKTGTAYHIRHTLATATKSFGDNKCRLRSSKIQADGMQKRISPQ